MDTNKIKYCSISIAKLLKFKYRVPPTLTIDEDGRMLWNGSKIQLGGTLNANTGIEYAADYSAYFDPNWKNRKLVDKSYYAGVLSY